MLSIRYWILYEGKQAQSQGRQWQETRLAGVLGKGLFKRWSLLERHVIQVEDLVFCWYWKEVFYYPCVYVHSLINPEKSHWCIPARQTVLVVSRAFLGDWWSLWSLRNRYTLWVVFQSTALCSLKLSENVIWGVRGGSLIDTVLYLKIIGFEKKMEVVIFSEWKPSLQHEKKRLLLLN